MDKKYDLIVAGHLCLDVIPRFGAREQRPLDELLVPGKLVNMRDVVLSTGGPVSNTGLNAITLGVRVELMGKIGDDLFGRGVLDLVERHGAAEGMIVMPGESTSYTIALAPPGIDRIFLHNPGSNDTYSSKDIDYDKVGQSRLFHLGYPPLMRRLYLDSGAETTAIFRKVSQSGVATSLDMALPDPDSESGRVDWQAMLRNTLPFVDFFLPSVEESMFMLDRGRFFAIKEEAGGRDAVDFYTENDVRKMGQAFVDMGARVVVLTAGHRGAYLRTAEAEKLSRVPGFTSELVQAWADRELWAEPFIAPKFGSATGSGDSFIAAILAAFLRGKSAEEALTIANCVGCLNVTEMDALGGVRPWDEVQRATAELSRRHVALDSEAWEHSAAEGLWRPRR